MVDMRPFGRKVRRSLLNRDLMAGVPVIGLLFLIIMLVVFIYVLRMFFMVAFVAVVYLIMRYLTSKDPWFIDIVLNSLQEKDIFLP
jgi:type IV secretory pathway VirB3-like protein